jgi:chromosome partitioning protein
MKGGVGKTTMASQLAYASAASGHRVLAVDLDPQANLSQSILGAEKYVKYLTHGGATVVQLFEDYLPPAGDRGAPEPIDLSDVILSKAGYWRTAKSLDLIPSRLELSRTLKNPTGKERRLAKGLSRVSENYDLVVIDCAPTESILTDAAYFASRYVIVPVKLEFMATIGLPLLARSVRDFKLENEDHEIDIAGLVLNISEYASYGEREKALQEIQQNAEEFGWRIFKTHVPYSRSLPKAARLGLPLADTPHAKWERIETLRELTWEIRYSIGLDRPVRPATDDEL